MDVYADGVFDLRGYQIALQVAGGPDGNMTLESVYVCAYHQDFVFADREYHEATDELNGRLAGAWPKGGTSIRTVYLGTFRFRSSPGAPGPFTFEPRVEETYMLNSAGVPIPVRVESNASVTVQ